MEGFKELLNAAEDKGYFAYHKQILENARWTDQMMTFELINMQRWLYDNYLTIVVPTCETWAWEFGYKINDENGETASHTSWNDLYLALLNGLNEAIKIIKK